MSQPLPRNYANRRNARYISNRKNTSLPPTTGLIDTINFSGTQGRSSAYSVQNLQDTIKENYFFPGFSYKVFAYKFKSFRNSYKQEVSRSRAGYDNYILPTAIHPGYRIPGATPHIPWYGNPPGFPLSPQAQGRGDYVGAQQQASAFRTLTSSYKPARNLETISLIKTQSAAYPFDRIQIGSTDKSNTSFVSWELLYGQGSARINSKTGLGVWSSYDKLLTEDRSFTFGGVNNFKNYFLPASNYSTIFSENTKDYSRLKQLDGKTIIAYNRLNSIFNNRNSDSTDYATLLGAGALPLRLPTGRYADFTRPGSANSIFYTATENPIAIIYDKPLPKHEELAIRQWVARESRVRLDFKVSPNIFHPTLTRPQ